MVAIYFFFGKGKLSFRFFVGKRSNELLQELSIEIRFHAYYHHQQQDVQKENKKDLYASEKIFSLVYILFILRKYHLFLLVMQNRVVTVTVTWLQILKSKLGFPSHY